MFLPQVVKSHRPRDESKRWPAPEPLEASKEKAPATVKDGDCHRERAILRHWQGTHRWRGAAMQQLRNRRSWRDGASGENPLRTAREVNAVYDPVFRRNYRPVAGRRMVGVAKGWATGLLLYPATDRRRRSHFESALAVKIESRTPQRSDGLRAGYFTTRVPWAWWRRYSPTTSAMTLSPVPARVRNRAW